MNNIYIKRVNEDDLEELHNLFLTTISDNFKKEGIGDDLVSITNEVNNKNQNIKNDILSNGKDRYFLLLYSNNKIIGTASFGKSSDLIRNLSDNKLKNIVEIGDVYILPSYQNKGLGTLLLNSIFLSLLSRGIYEFCLDSGYTIAKQIWAKKLGEPYIIKKDYWDEGVDHHIWYTTIKEIQLK